MIKSQREQDLREPICEKAYRFDDRGDISGSYTECRCWLTNPDIRKEVIQLVATMQRAPTISENAMRYFVEGNVFMKAAKNFSDYKLAIRKYKEALVEAPWWGDAYNNLGIAMNAAECREDAKLALELYLLTKPADASKAQIKIYDIGAKNQLEEEHGRRCEEFEREVNQGNGDYGNRRYDAAIEHAKKGLEACPEHPEAYTAYCNLAIAYVDGKKNYDEGLKYAQKGLELKPDDLRCNGIMGIILWGRGDHPGACRYWQKACQLGGQNACKNYKSLCP